MTSRSFAVLSCIFSAAFPASAATIHVGADEDIAAAVASAEAGSVIELDEATYQLTAPLVLSKELTVRGKGPDKTALSLSGFNLTGDTQHAITIESADAKIESLTVFGANKQNGGNYSEANGGVIHMAGGTLSCLVISNNVCNQGNIYGITVTMTGPGIITNCLFRNNRQTNGGGGGYGCGVYMKAGEVVDCRFIDNTMSHYGDHGGGVYAKGGAVRRCYFKGNGCNYGTYSTVEGTGGCALVLDGATAIADSCLVVSNFMSGVLILDGTLVNSVVTGHKTGNSEATWPAGVYMKKGVMRNCTIAGNTSPCEGSGFQMAAGTAVNNVIYGNGSVANAKVSGGVFNTNVVNTATAGVGNITSSPKFVSPSTLDFSVGLDSPALNAGQTFDDYSHDISGIARPQGTGWDIGAYECVIQEGSIVCSAVIAADKWLLGSSPAASAKVIGAPDGAEISYVWYVDGELVAGVTGVDASFDGLGPGGHSVKVVATVNGVDYPSATVEDAFTLFPDEVYVDLNGSNTSPYDTPAKAAHAISDALASVWMDETVTARVNVADGVYPLTSCLFINTPVRIRGAGSDRTFIDCRANAGRSFVVNAPDAVIDSLTICNAKCSSATAYDATDSGVINMTAGTLSNLILSNNVCNQGNIYGITVTMRGAGIITNCLFSNNRQTNGGGGGYGCGVYMTDGKVIDCRFSNNVMEHYGDRGAGVYMKGGLVSGCHFSGNAMKNWNYSDIHGCGGGAIYLDGANAVAERCVVATNFANGVYIANGTLRNSLVIGHDTDGTAGISAQGIATAVYMKGGLLANCTIAANTNRYSAATSDLIVAGGRAVNNIATFASVSGGETTANCFNESVAFRDPAQGDFSLTARAKNCIDKGDMLDYDAASVDLAGNPRVFNFAGKQSRPDFGCLESEFGLCGTFLMIR